MTANGPVVRKIIWLEAANIDLYDIPFRAVTPYELFEFAETAAGVNLGGPLLRSLVILLQVIPARHPISVIRGPYRTGLSQGLSDHHRSTQGP